MDEKRIKTLKKWADDFEIELMFSIFNKKSLEMVKILELKKYKIASRTVVGDIDLVKEIVDLNKKTYISLGMWNESKLPIEGKENIEYL